MVATERRANENGRTRDKAREDEAIKRILRKRGIEAMQAPEDETDEELIEACWQDLVTDGACRETQACSEDELVEENLKKPRLSEPDFDLDPRLPGNCGNTSAINARLWSQMRGRTSINTHTAIQEGMQSENFAKRTRGTTSERASKFQRGTAGRIQIDAMHAIDRLLKHGTATSSSCPPRNSNTGSCSSKAGLGGFLKKPP